MQALASQWLAFSQGFHVVPWVAALVLALAAIAITRLHRLAPGARAIAILAALSAAAAVLLHPQSSNGVSRRRGCSPSGSWRARAAPSFSHG
jgi:hypothetical protein